MAKRTSNQDLKALISEAGLTYEGLAHAVRVVARENGDERLTNKSAVSHWTHGIHPSEPTAGYLAEALSRRVGRRITRLDLGLAPGNEGEDDTIGLTMNDPVETLTALGEADVKRRQFLTASAYSVAAAALPLGIITEAAARSRSVATGAVTGHADVAAVRDLVTVFMTMDERYGGQHGRSAFGQYLVTDVAALCRARHSSEQVRSEAFSVASAAAHLAGWKAYDSGEQGLAQRYFLQSLALARESNVPGQDGFVMRTMSQQGMKLQRPELCLATIESGWSQAKGRVPASVEALFGVTHAHALAKTGQRHAALTGISRAQAALAADDGAEIPFWALAWGPPAATVHSRIAKTHLALGDRQNAGREYAAAAANRPVTYARIVALDLVAQAEQQAQQGNVEQACATWSKALDHMDGVRSARTHKAVQNIRRDLARFRARGARCAAELDERAAAVLANA